MPKKTTNKKVSKKKPEKKLDEDMTLFPEAEVEDWIHDEDGQLSVDVHETSKEIVIRSAIAGVRPEDLELSIHNDMLTIRGQRHLEEETTEDIMTAILVPVSTILKNLSGFLNIPDNILALLSPCFAKYFSRILSEEMTAVSTPEKKAAINKQTAKII